jgi:hypothetical protein
MSFMALLVLGAALPLQGYIGLILGTPTGGNEFGACEGAELLEPTVGNLYLGREGSPSGSGWNDNLAVLNGGNDLIGCNSWAGGFFDCPGGNFAPEPTTAEEAVWAVVPMYPAGEAAGDHRGWLFMDVTAGTTADFGFNVTQGLWPLSADPGAAQGGTTADPNSGFDYRIRAVVEFGRDMTGSGPTCRVGGDAMGTDFDDRPLLGYNVYRISGVAAATSTPDHYLYGPDLTPGTADDGWVGFIPSGTGAGGSGLNLSDAQASASANDNDTADAYGVEGTGASVEDDVHLIYSDNPLFGNVGTGELADTMTYVFQPVLKGDATTHPNGGDVDGDTIPDVDLDGDTTPEFISPGGVGLGLTADIGGSRAILISGDITADGSTPTPAGDAVQFEGSYNARTGAFDLHFISSLEADLAGFNLYRSEDARSFRQVNGSLIPAKGTALAKYVYTDPMRIRTRSGEVTVYYKVEAVNLDGSTDLYGPYSVTYTAAGEAHRSRSIR